MNPKWEKICKTSNVILSILYAVFWFPLGYFGLFPLLMGTDVWVVIGLIFSFVIIPLSCIFSIIFSIRFRKKQKYAEAFLIQFAPLFEFYLSMLLFFKIIWSF